MSGKAVFGIICWVCSSHAHTRLTRTHVSHAHTFSSFPSLQAARRVLDLCTGSGVQGITAARYYADKVRRTWSI